MCAFTGYIMDLYKTGNQITSHFYGINTQKRHPQPQVPHITLTLSALLTLHICSPSGEGHILTAIHPYLISPPSMQSDLSLQPSICPFRSPLTHIQSQSLLTAVIHSDLSSLPTIQISSLFSIQISHHGHPFKYILLKAIHLDISSSQRSI
jgi:hypothetical protein